MENTNMILLETHSRGIGKLNSLAIRINKHLALGNTVGILGDVSKIEPKITIPFTKTPLISYHFDNGLKIENIAGYKYEIAHEQKNINNSK